MVRVCSPSPLSRLQPLPCFSPNSRNGRGLLDPIILAFSRFALMSLESTAPVVPYSLTKAALSLAVCPALGSRNMSMSANTTGSHPGPRPLSYPPAQTQSSASGAPQVGTQSQLASPGRSGVPMTQIQVPETLAFPKGTLIMNSDALYDKGTHSSGSLRPCHSWNSFFCRAHKQTVSWN